jgi:anti-anti-sigma regulatory factor
MSDEQTTIESLRAELEAERTLRREAERRMDALERLLAQAPGILVEQAFGPGDGSTTYISGADVEALLGYPREEIIAHPGDFWNNHIHPEDLPRAAQEGADIVTHGWANLNAHRLLKKDGGVIWVETYFRHEAGGDGLPARMFALAIDVTRRIESEQETRRLLAEEKLLREQLDGIAAAREEERVRVEVLRAQEESLLALSTPLVPIDDELLAMPLVGALDARRGERALQTLLEGVAGTSARAVILDVTGVPEMDAGTAEGLLRAARAVQLLGAEVVLTGIRADVARTLVALGADLGKITTRSTLKAGIAHVLGKRRERG